MELLFRFIDAGNIGEGDGGLVCHEHPRPALAERERLVIRALGLAHHEEQQAAEEHQRQDVEQDLQPVAELRGLFEHDARVLELFRRHPVVPQLLGDRAVGVEARVRLPLVLVLDLESVFADLDTANAAVLYAGGYLVEADCGGLAIAGLGERREEKRDDGDQEDEVNKTIPEPLAVHFHGSPWPERGNKVHAQCRSA